MKLSAHIHAYRRFSIPVCDCTERKDAAICPYESHISHNGMTTHLRNTISMIYSKHRQPDG